MRVVLPILFLVATAILLWGAWSYGWNALTRLPTRDAVQTAAVSTGVVTRKSVTVGADGTPPAQAPEPAPAEPAPGTEGSRVRFVEEDGIVGVRIEGPLERAPATEPTVLPGQTPAPGPGAAPPVDEPDVYRLVVIESAGVIDARTHKIRLAHVTAPVETATCTQPGGKVWPCGMRARTAMRRLIRRRSIECFDLKPVDPEAKIRPATCEVGGTDLAAWLVEQGWAEPDDTAPDAWRELNAAAKSAGKGIYADKPQAELMPGIPG